MRRFPRVLGFVVLVAAVALLAALVFVAKRDNVARDRSAEEAKSALDSRAPARPEGGEPRATAAAERTREPVG